MDALHWSLFGGLVLALAGWGWEAFTGGRARKRHGHLLAAERTRAREWQELAESRLRRLRGASHYLSEGER